MSKNSKRGIRDSARGYLMNRSTLKNALLVLALTLISNSSYAFQVSCEGPVRTLVFEDGQQIDADELCLSFEDLSDQEVLEQLQEKETVTLDGEEFETSEIFEVFSTKRGKNGGIEPFVRDPQTDN